MSTQLKQYLEQLAHELQCANLWRETPPKPQELASVVPFCVDTLTFEQWLQWIFIPKLSALMDAPNFSGVPNQSAIHTMAAHAFAEYAQNTDSICAIIKRIDTALNRFPH